MSVYRASFPRAFFLVVAPRSAATATGGNARAVCIAETFADSRSDHDRAVEAARSMGGLIAERRDARQQMGIRRSLGKNSLDQTRGIEVGRNKPAPTEPAGKAE